MSSYLFISPSPSLNSQCRRSLRAFAPTSVSPIRIVLHPYAKTNSSKSHSGSKRPRSNKNTSSGFTTSSKQPSQNISQVPASSRTDQQQNPDTPSQRISDSKTPDLQKLDANGISLEHRLREEIQHPLRRPKQTLFATLAFSATLGFFFACGRLAAEKDSFAQVAQNVAIDIIAITVFAYLTWREYDFGRRSLNSIAGCPQPRDLPISIANNSSVSSLSILSSTQRLSSLIKQSDIVIIAGRVSDLQRYIQRCIDISTDKSAPVLVAFATDVRENMSDVCEGADAFPASDDEAITDWVAWLGEAVPPRRNVALFRIDARDAAVLPASDYIVAVEDPISLPLPSDARRPEIVEV